MVTGQTVLVVLVAVVVEFDSLVVVVLFGNLVVGFPCSQCPWCICILGS